MTATDRRRRCTVLLVEDDTDHAALVLRALDEASIGADVAWTRDGADALDYLRRQGRYRDTAFARRPDLILLDIKLPKLDGHDVLRAVKTDPDLRTIPVVMLTTSAADGDLSTSYGEGANSFVTKPVRFSEFAEKVRDLTLYWIATNVPPDC